MMADVSPSTGSGTRRRKERFPLDFFIFISCFPLVFVKKIPLIRLGFVRKSNNFLCISKKMATFAPVYQQK